MWAIASETNEKLFLEAPGECGKTFVYATILNIFRGQGHITLAATCTGIAALLLDGGTTLSGHLVFLLLCCLLQFPSITATSERATVLCEAPVILIYEVSMIPAAAADYIDHLLTDTMKYKDLLLSTVPIGGKMILLCGGFRQILLVVPMANTS